MGPATPAKTRPAKAQETRERILGAALASFTEKGFDGATTREIASRAGVNVGLLVYYFGDKSRLWRAAVDRAFADLREGIGKALREATDLGDREQLARLVRGYVRYVARRPEFVRLMHEEGKRSGPRMRWLVDRHVKPLYETTAKLVRRAQRAGQLPPSMAPIHFHYILAGSVGLIFHQAAECRRLFGQDPMDEAVVEAHADAVIHFLLGPPGEAART